MTMATSTTAANGLFQAVRIKKLELWGSNAGTGTPATIYVQWSPGSENAAPLQAGDTTLSTDEPAHVVTRPPRASAASFWQGLDQNSDVMFSIATQGLGALMIDITLQLVVANGNAGNLITVAGASAGTVYYMSLDSMNGTAYLPPVAGQATVSL